MAVSTAPDQCPPPPRSAGDARSSQGTNTHTGPRQRPKAWSLEAPGRTDRFEWWAVSSMYTRRRVTLRWAWVVRRPEDPPPAHRRKLADIEWPHRDPTFQKASRGPWRADQAEGDTRPAGECHHGCYPPNGGQGPKDGTARLGDPNGPSTKGGTRVLGSRPTRPCPCRQCAYLHLTSTGWQPTFAAAYGWW